MNRLFKRHSRRLASIDEVLFSAAMFCVLLLGGYAPESVNAESLRADKPAQKETKVFSPDRKMYAFVRSSKDMAPNGAGEASIDVIYLATGSAPARPLFKKGTTFDTKQPLGKITLSGITDLVFSPTKPELYFLNAGYAVSGIVLAIDLDTGGIRQVIDGNSINWISTGKWRGNLLVERHKYNDNGAYNVQCAVSPAGKELAELKRVD
ncbi:MAG: hypothetical protein K2W95_23030 [Candidatus Obscuribacterales bacterium]|nr:hypothetical protein [Candidatus Obscuribacterales bacterium]